MTMKWNLSEKNRVWGGGEKFEKYVPELFDRIFLLYLTSRDPCAPAHTPRKF